MAQKVCCEIERVIDHGERVYSLVLRSEHLLPRFQPGQFLHLALDEYQPGDFWPDSRAFSIASSPSDRQSLRLTYAVKGNFTGRMEAELAVGRTVWIKLPHGEFIIAAAPQICLLAGGTGITAFTAFIAGLAPDYPGRIYLAYGARRADLLIYRPLVEAARQHCSNLLVWYFVEEPLSDKFVGKESDLDACHTGRIDATRVWEALPEPTNAHFYLSGPPVMLQALSQAFIKLGALVDRLHIDAWE